MIAVVEQPTGARKIGLAHTMPPEEWVATRLGTLRRPENTTAAESLAGIAHDARNAVTALRLCAELIAEPGVLSPGQEQYRTELLSVVEGTDRVIRRLSALARPAARAANQAPVSTPVKDLAASLHQLRGFLASVAGPAIALEMPDLPCAELAGLSEENLMRIVLNLVRNAADAMPGGGRIRITAQRSGQAVPTEKCEPSGQPGELNPLSTTVTLCVEDSGPGIPADLLERVFEPGFSTRRGRMPWPEALHHGLGLSIVRELVEEAGGTVQATTRPGRGTRLKIDLPLTNVTPPLLSEPELNRGGEAR